MNFMELLTTNKAKANGWLFTNQTSVLIGTGVALGITGAIMLARAHKRGTAELKAELDEIRLLRAEIDDPEIEVEDLSKALTHEVGRFVWSLVKIYGPAVTVGLL